VEYTATPHSVGGTGFCVFRKRTKIRFYKGLLKQMRLSFCTLRKGNGIFSDDRVTVEGQPPNVVAVMNKYAFWWHVTVLERR
jgi:hypothetical protein